MRYGKTSKKAIPINNLYNRCMKTLVTLSANANNDFDPSAQIDQLVLEVCKMYDPQDKDCDFEEIISRVAMNMVYGWTDQIPF